MPRTAESAANRVAARPLLFGELLYDRFPDGARVLGGAPFIVARHLQAFGLAPRLISRVGDDREGAEIIAAMRRFGMATDGIQQDGRLPTGRVDVTLEESEPTFSIRHPVAWDAIEPVDPALLDGAGLLYHGSLALRDATSRHALDSLRAESDLPIFLDVNLRPPWWSADAVRRLVAGARWVKLNHAELAALAGGDVEAAAAGELLALGATELLVVTRGARGAVAYPRDTAPVAVPAPAAAVSVVDTVGAGDAFAAVVIAGLLMGWPLAVSLARAQSFAIRIVGCRGAVPDDDGPYDVTRAEWERG